MAKLKPATILTRYFNDGKETKKSAVDFREEVKKLGPDEKAELVDLAAQELGVEVTLS